MVQAGKDNPPELAPELVIADALPGNRRVVRGWMEEPPGGGDPVFTTETDTVALTFTPYAGLTGHMLSIYERMGGDWQRITLTAVADPAGGSSSTQIDFTVIKKPGEWMFYVESTIPENGGASAILRSSIAALEVREVAQPVTGGGSP